MSAFERQLSREITRLMGPARPVEEAAISSAISARPSRWRFQLMSDAVKFIAAGAIVALFGGIVISSGPSWPQPQENPAAAGAVSPAAPIASSLPSLSSPGTKATPVPVPDAVDDAIVMGPGEGIRFGGYRQVGRFDDGAFAAGSMGGVVGPVMVGDRLVIVVHVNEKGGREARDVLLRTSDGRTWLPSTVPGSTPWIDGLAATSDGLIAVGHDGSYGGWQARIWASEDGEVWTTLDAPPDRGLTRIVSGAGPLAVTSFDWLWVRGDDGHWEKGIRLTNMGILSGPGGSLAWDARTGPETRAYLMRSTDLLEWDDVDLSGSPGLAEAVGAGGFAIHATDEEWFLVPNETSLADTIFTSRDGLVWQQAARPPEMDRPSWIAEVGDEVHALQGIKNGDMRTRLWTWRPSEDAGPPERAPRQDARRLRLLPPIEWRGDRVTVAFESPGTPRAVSLWRYDDGAE